MTDAEIVRECAEKVMGWPCRLVNAGWIIDHPERGTLLSSDWNPLTSEADCWGMVGKLATGEFTLERNPSIKGGYHWYVDFGDGATQGRDPDRRRAIVLACLRAVGVEV